MKPMDNTFMLIGSLLGFLGVAAGAFGAHGLRSRLSPEMLVVFETAVRYQMYHVFALLITAAAIGRIGDARLLSIAGWSFIAGTLLFSGSLYALVFTGMSGLGAITPVGGLAFLVGWACLAMFAAAR
jgi:uncharacterized membrane protein YgdD (TMEM256/DUF423 family)